MLDALGMGMVGGLILTVGTSGLLIGSGRSHYLERRATLAGKATDNIVRFEIVYEDSAVVMEAPRETLDLYVMLKDGSVSQFGIVTRFDQETFAAMPFWSKSIHTFEDYQDGAAMVCCAYNPTQPLIETSGTVLAAPPFEGP
ncbi:hypothetical protein SLS62_005468 [Diatrype stigma]|uniref:Uncharacterized protein n=1 Tax=Diatrype stigma TaxID=117547 RepID=A0AAN9UUQ8_9PEZI